MRILIVGIGYVGEVTAQLLARDGHEVFGLRRSARPLPEGVQPLRGDVTRPDGLEEVPDGVETVLFAVSPGSRQEEAYEATYVRGVSHVVDRLPAARVLFVSSTAVYGSAEGDPVDETTEPRPDDGPSRKIFEAERVVARAGARNVILRASGIYGPGRTRLLARLARADVDESDRALVTNRIHRVDLARALTHFVTRAELSGTYVASDEEPASLGAMCDWLAQETVPPALLEAPARAPRAERRARSRKLSSEKLRSTGFSFLFPTFREGYRAVLRELAERP